MKTTIILFILTGALLSGCSTNYNYPSKKITVHKTNGTKKEYALISVRGDSALAVLDWSEAQVIPIPFSHIEVLKKDSIRLVVRDGVGGGANIGLGIIGGVAIGTGIGILLSPNPPPQPNTIPTLLVYPLTDFSYQLAKVIVIGGSIILAAVLGGVIGNAFPPDMEMSFRSAKDREFLRSISLYPDKEPDKMQYIK